jgi:hypothetical protein
MVSGGSHLPRFGANVGLLPRCIRSASLALQGTLRTIFPAGQWVADQLDAAEERAQFGLRRPGYSYL